MSRSFRSSRLDRWTSPSRRMTPEERGPVLPMESCSRTVPSWIAAAFAVAAVAGGGLVLAIGILGAVS